MDHVFQVRFGSLLPNMTEPARRRIVEDRTGHDRFFARVYCGFNCNVVRSRLVVRQMATRRQVFSPDLLESVSLACGV